MKLKISPGFALITALMILFDQNGACWQFLLAAALHEAAHVAALKRAGADILSFELNAAGGVTRIAAVPAVSYAREAAAVLAGPAANLAAAIFCALLARHVSDGVAQRWLFMFSGVNAMMGAFNLLPAGSLDGGRAILLLASLRGRADAGTAAMTLSTLLLSLILLPAGIYSLVHTGWNFSLLAAGLFLLVSGLADGWGILKCS